MSNPTSRGRRLLRPALALAAFTIAAPAFAAPSGLVSFDSLASPMTDLAGDGQVYEEAGLRFANPPGLPGELVHWGQGEPFNADPNGATLFQNIPDSGLVITRIGGGSFTLQSIDLADVFNAGIAGRIGYSFSSAQGEQRGVLTLDDQVGLQTFELGLVGVRAFRLEQFEPYFQLDNLRFELDPIVAVPEPASWSMFVVAALVAVSARRLAGHR